MQCTLDVLFSLGVPCPKTVKFSEAIQKFGVQIYLTVLKSSFLRVVQSNQVANNIQNIKPVPNSRCKNVFCLSVYA